MNFFIKTDALVKNDHYLGVSALFRDPGTEDAIRSPLDTLTGGLRNKEWGKLTFLYILPACVSFLNVIYHSLAIVVHVAELFFKPLLILHYYGWNKEGLAQAAKAFVERSFAILTNCNQIIRSLISAIPLIGPWLTYSYDFTAASLLQIPGIHQIGQKVDAYIHHSENRSPLLHEGTKPYYNAFSATDTNGPIAVFSSNFSDALCDRMSRFDDVHETLTNRGFSDIIAFFMALMIDEHVRVPDSIKNRKKTI